MKKEATNFIVGRGLLWKTNSQRESEATQKLFGRHLFPSAKLTFSSQRLSQDISLFLHEISLSLKISVHKSLSLFNF